MSKIDEWLAAYGIGKLEVLTRYPSIMPYHELGLGGVKNVLYNACEFPKDEELVIGTEKLNGIDFRLVIAVDDFLLGNRECFVYAMGDRVCTDLVTQRLLPVAYSIYQCLTKKAKDARLTVIFGQVYGYNIQRPRYNPVDNKEVGYALFDCWQLPVNDAETLLGQNIEAIYNWRERNYQPWLTYSEMDELFTLNGFDLVPDCWIGRAASLPRGAEETYEWIQRFHLAKAVFDRDGRGEWFGKTEGIVLRTRDRKWIRKLRIEDYEKGSRRAFL